MPAAGTSCVSLFNSAHVLLSHRLFSSTDMLHGVSIGTDTAPVYGEPTRAATPGRGDSRKHVGAGPGRCVLDVVVARHVLGDDGDHIVWVARKQQGAREPDDPGPARASGQNILRWRMTHGPESTLTREPRWLAASFAKNTSTGFWVTVLGLTRRK